jgi:hypothetical protein
MLMQSPLPEDAFIVMPEAVPVGDAGECRWSVYLIRVDLDRHRLGSALKIGMVGSGTIARRLNEHRRTYGRVELVGVWTLVHAARRLDRVSAWRLVEQYEARLQFAPEYVDPYARLRRLRPDGQLYSYEWFEDDQRVVDAVERFALQPVTLPCGWSLAAGPDVHGPTR